MLADQVIAATGLITPNRLAKSAGLRWNNGIEVNAQTLETSEPHIYALGDCISINGQSSRYIEPILRQAQTLAAALIHAAKPDAALTDNLPPYSVRTPVVRVKTTSLPLTLH